MSDPIMREMANEHTEFADWYKEKGEEKQAEWHKKHAAICRCRAEISRKSRDGDTIPLQEVVSPRRSQLVEY